MNRVTLLCLLVAGLLVQRPAAAERTAFVLKINGPIGPMTYSQVRNTLADAQRESADLVMLCLDTPGGLLASTRKIVQEILQSPVPVVAFVSPRGAQCASAGTFIALACHLVAMAPATNIGAAHPVTIGGEPDRTMSTKILNDTVSFIKSVAEVRKRNAAWAEDAVRKSVSSTEQEALRAGAIDLIADDIPDLLAKIDGRSVALPGRTVVLRTRGLIIREDRPRFGNRILSLLSDPTVAYLLALIGIIGIIIELSHPGMALPGIVGTLALVLSFFAFQTISLNMTGIILLLVSLILFVLEAVTPGFGPFLVSGLIALFLGTFMLARPEAEMRASYVVMLLAPLVTGAILTFFLWFAHRTKRRRVTTGREGLIGEIGTALADCSPEGEVFVHGERWRARSEGGPIARGRPVIVRGVRGLLLIVAEGTDGEPAGQS